MSLNEAHHKFGLAHLALPRMTHRFRFSLRAFLVLVGLFCLAVGWYASTVYRQRRAVHIISELGGSCHYDDEYRFQPKCKLVGTYRDLQQVRIEPEKRSWLRTVLGDDWFADISYVSFHGKQITNKEFETIATSLSTLPKLKRLSLSNTAVDHRALIYLQPVRHLKKLDLYMTPIRMDDAGMMDLLQALPELQISYIGH
jgi:hypothetical protein